MRNSQFLWLMKVFYNSKILKPPTLTLTFTKNRHWKLRVLIYIRSYSQNYPFRVHLLIGGDGYNMEKRVNPLNNGRINLVAIWSGIVKTGINGEATFEFDIPQFSGDLHIMAVAYKDETFGSATKNIKIAFPLVISTALPRFASPNDEIQVTVNNTNTTKQAANITATITIVFF